MNIVQQRAMISMEISYKYYHGLSSRRTAGDAGGLGRRAFKRAEFDCRPFSTRKGKEKPARPEVLHLPVSAGRASDRVFFLACWYYSLSLVWYGLSTCLRILRYLSCFSYSTTLELFYLNPSPWPVINSSDFLYNHIKGWIPQLDFTSFFFFYPLLRQVHRSGSQPLPYNRYDPPRLDWTAFLYIYISKTLAHCILIIKLTLKIQPSVQGTALPRGSASSGSRDLCPDTCWNCLQHV